MTNIIFYIQLFKTSLHIITLDKTVYVDAHWYRKLCNSLRMSEWELDKLIYEVTKCQHLAYTHTKCRRWIWDEKEQRYK